MFKYYYDSLTNMNDVKKNINQIMLSLFDNTTTD